ncbi:carboxymuconolactone decarboxylase family protein [Nocardia fluminea]|jgi:4-carboxymuconolactone decarboxylase|uniref:Alkylhydroperoxidase family enzyme n=1 Tax=Nocardia fluminea TaxID=134984 RepID=A0A2N3VKV9_9NOCA|nr:carboxymuconolactone decarboxylase family protein [Nocardia fluminea]PKV82253.1 alkylhydroperoxidase family enzyme [Nocardia fluminea]
MNPAAPRLAPLPVREWGETTRAMFRGHVKSADRYLTGEPDAPPMPGILGVLAHHTELASAWLAYNGLLLERPTVDPRERELVILRVAWRSESDYEWAQHVRTATALGITAQQIEAVRYGPQAAVWSPVQRALLAMTDQLLDRHRVDDATWAQLERYFDSRQLIELLFVAGSYLCLAMVFNSVALQPDPEQEERS